MNTVTKFLIGIFAAIFIGVVIWVIQTTPEETEVQSPKIDPPKEMIYEGGSTITEEQDGKVIWELSAEKIAVTIENQNATLSNVAAKFYQDDGNTIAVRADNGTLHREQKNIYLEGKVIVEMSDGKKITCDEMNWITDDEKLTAVGNVILNDENAELTSDKVEYFPTSNNATASGNVKFKREDVFATGDQFESMNNFNQFKLTGHAHIKKGVYN